MPRRGPTANAREHADRIAHFSDGLQCVRVQSPTRAGAIIAGATFYEADTIILAERTGMRGRFALFFGAIHRLLREAPCDVRVIYKVGQRRLTVMPRAAPAVVRVSGCRSHPPRHS